MSVKANLKELKALDLDFDWENAFRPMRSISLFNIKIVPVSVGGQEPSVDGSKKVMPALNGFSVAYRDWKASNYFLVDDEQMFTSEENAKEWFDKSISFFGFERLTKDEAVDVANEYLDCCKHTDAIVKDLEKSFIRGRCKHCAFYNVITDEDGACRNPDFHTQVTTLTKEFLLGNLKVSDFAAEVIVGSLRVNDNFGCIHFEKQTNEVKSD